LVFEFTLNLEINRSEAALVCLLRLGFVTLKSNTKIFCFSCMRLLGFGDLLLDTGALLFRVSSRRGGLEIGEFSLVRGVRVGLALLVVLVNIGDPLPVLRRRVFK
jgi:hypothetical protein